ncbi:MAG: hypothetical protein ACYS30_03710 [Planctomycetota bacterium]|jgi:hypothetical protein
MSEQNGKEPEEEKVIKEISYHFQNSSSALYKAEITDRLIGLFTQRITWREKTDKYRAELANEFGVKDTKTAVSASLSALLVTHFA